MDRHRPADPLAAGLCATVDSDDPAYFGGYVDDDHLAAFEALPQLGVQQAHRLARNGFEASFASGERKAAWITSLDEVFERF